MGDHTETVLVEYDPAVISYETLLDLFFSQHAADARSSRQYRSVIFATTPEQTAAAEAKAAAVGKRRGRPVGTAIEPAGTFYLAEE